jgi:tetratricopeptide (TPR) repeat protein
VEARLMSDPFLSSDDYADQAHQLYNEGRYDEALEVLHEALAIYPGSAELHVGKAYARLAREEVAWARRSFEDALGLDADHEDALAGFGEVLLKLGQRARAMACFEQVLVLGFRDDHDLMLQIGRALFRESVVEHALRFFTIASDQHPDSAEAAGCVGFAEHRRGDEPSAIAWLKRALELEPAYTEARIYLGNLLYDRGEYEAALAEFEKTEPDDHIDELALWRMIELKKSIYKLKSDDPEFAPWAERLAELVEDGDAIETLLAEVEATHPDGTVRDPMQLEMFSTLLTELQGMRRRNGESHRVTTHGGRTYTGTWEEIVLLMLRDDPAWSRASLGDYMTNMARQRRAETGVIIPVTDAESFVRGSAEAGLLTIHR